MNLADVTITGQDQRRGMGIGGWWMRWTARHEPTGCAVEWETRGRGPASQHEMKERALAALELMVEVYEPAPSSEHLSKKQDCDG